MKTGVDLIKAVQGYLWSLNCILLPLLVPEMTSRKFCRTYPLKTSSKFCVPSPACLRAVTSGRNICYCPYLSPVVRRSVVYSAPPLIPVPARSYLYVYVFAAVLVIVTLSFVVVCIYSHWS